MLAINKIDVRLSLQYDWVMIVMDTISQVVPHYIVFLNIDTRSIELRLNIKLSGSNNYHSNTKVFYLSGSWYCFSFGYEDVISKWEHTSYSKKNCIWYKIGIKGHVLNKVLFKKKIFEQNLKYMDLWDRLYFRVCQMYSIKEIFKTVWRKGLNKKEVLIYVKSHLETLN